MKNREKFLKCLSELTNIELAAVMCKIMGCEDCLAIDKCRKSGLDGVTEWMQEEAEGKETNDS